MWEWCLLGRQPHQLLTQLSSVSSHYSADYFQCFSSQPCIPQRKMLLGQSFCLLFWQFLLLNFRDKCLLFTLYLGFQRGLWLQERLGTILILSWCSATQGIESSLACKEVSRPTSLYPSWTFQSVREMLALSPGQRSFQRCCLFYLGKHSSLYRIKTV